MKIKTISIPLIDRRDFDEEVNAALAEGWVLAKREVLWPQVQGKNSMLYAELVLPDAPAEPEKPADLMEAMRMIYAECCKYDRCINCSLFNVCDGGSPDNWRIGYAEEEENG